ncbi:MAG TPA: hypothetical protein VN706_22075 [Gemmatimonadaceae bacterium]|nr:hypothetical protein [Gemmatimonadaceae bacterium]
MSEALRALLHGVVDYAGLFPPAALDMPAAVREYDAYRTSADAWMLGRFVVSVARLDEFGAALEGVHPAGPAPWAVSALAGPDIAGDVQRVRAFNAIVTNAAIDTLECKAVREEDIVAAAAFGHDEFVVFAELPVSPDPAALVRAVKRAGIHAKVRTGGVTAEAFPAPGDIVRFIRCCLDAGVPFKATAGLHHPIRGDFRLTYADDAPHGPMYGYLNVFLAAAFMAQGTSDADAERIVTERDASAFTFAPHSVAWHGRQLDASALASARQRVATSFGSCSFREPVDDLRLLGFLP